MRTPDRPPPPPPVQRLRVRYARRGRMRFASHRDFQRALERALRRAGVPAAYSAGFTPRPKISYFGAAATGAASEAEYLELALARRCDPAAVRAGLDAALPEGFEVVEVVEAGPGDLADRLAASEWEVRLPGVAAEAATVALARFLGATSVPVERRLKEGRRILDARAAVLTAALRPAAGDCAILRLVVRHSTPAVRPDDVLAGLRAVADLVPPVPPSVTRLAQGPLADTVTGRLADPLAPDRKAAADMADRADGPAVVGAPGC